MEAIFYKLTCVKEFDTTWFLSSHYYNKVRTIKELGLADFDLKISMKYFAKQVLQWNSTIDHHSCLHRHFNLLELEENFEIG